MALFAIFGQEMRKIWGLWPSLLVNRESTALSAWLASAKMARARVAQAERSQGSFAGPAPPGPAPGPLARRAAGRPGLTHLTSGQELINYL